MALIIKGEQHKKTSQDLLREFSEQFASAYALGPASNWAEVVSTKVVTDAPEIVFPFPVEVAGYHEFKGEMKYRTLEGRAAKLKPKLWQDGVKELLDKMQQATWLGWNQQAAMLAERATHMPNKLLAAMIEANPYLSIYDDADTNTTNATYTLFYDAHLNDLIDSSHGTFDNNGLAGAGGFTTDNVGAWMDHFHSLKDPTGESSLGLELTHVLVPRQLARKARDFFNSDFLLKVFGSNTAAGQEQNLYKGAVEVLVSDELTSATVVYPLALNRPAMTPAVIMTNDTPEITELGEDSALYETSRNVGVNALLKVNAGPLFPQTIAKVTIS
jgi:hypothetical protein